MLGDKKIIGVYLDGLDSPRADYIDRLYSLAQGQGYELFVFNGGSDGAFDIFDNNQALDCVICETASSDGAACAQSTGELAEISLGMVCKTLADGGKGSCTVCFQGCEKTGGAAEQNADGLLGSMKEAQLREKFLYSWLSRMLDVADRKELYSVLAECLPENARIFLADELNEEYEAITSKGLQGNVKPADMICRAKNGAVTVITPISDGEKLLGYYVTEIESAVACACGINSTASLLGVAVKGAFNGIKLAQAQRAAENAVLTSPVSGLPNLKGSVKWFEQFSAVAENHSRTPSVSVSGLPKYAYIYANYGIKDAEEATAAVADMLVKSNIDDCFIGHISEDEFVIVNYYDDPNAISDTINSATSSFYSIIEEYNSKSGKEYYVEVNAGCTVINPGWNGSLEGFVKFANSEMYMNRLKQGTGSALKEQATPKEHYKTLDLLIEKNLFCYHFQPIVSARSGRIYAYEALMRTDKSIGMNPLEVLAAAKEFNRLYEIEKATMFNVAQRFADEHSDFGKSKVFINTIPGHFLNEEDLNAFVEEYGDYIGSFVFEITEQDTVSDEELNTIKKLSGGKATNRVAIDDYGTGHSNIVNLMRYAPKIIKIDRMLVSDIHKDRNKQMFVRSTIEFAKINNIKVLAEGIETADELRMVIELGVDFIQGYYTGRPQPQPIKAITDEIKREIVDANPLLKRKD